MIWLPYANVKANTDVLADGQLFDVVFQGLQCLRNIYQGDLNWRDAAAWCSRPAGLLFYVLAAEQEMQRRGFPRERKVFKAFTSIAREYESLSPVMPPWYGDPALHQSHRSHLIRIDPEHYTRRMPFTTPLELPLIWPGERKLA